MSEIPKRPKLMWNAISAMYAQVALSALSGVLLVYLAGVEADHGRDTPGLATVGYLEIVIAVVLLVGVVLVTRGVGWARVPIVVLEFVCVVIALITIFSGMIAGIANLGLCLVVLMNLMRRDVNDWFAAVARTRRPATG